MARKLKSDKVLFIAALLLVCASIVMVYSASVYVALDENKDAYHYVTRQTLFAILGVAALALAMRVDYRAYRSETFIYGVLGAIGLMLVLVLVPYFGPEVNGARRWLPILGQRFQPSEFAKIAVVLFTAMMLERRMHRIDDVRYSLGAIGIVVGLIAALIIRQPDFGTAVSLMLVVATMIFAAGLHYKYLAGGLLVGLPVMALVALSRQYRVERFMSFWNPEADPQGDGWQALQSLIAVGTGGVFGKGLSLGVQKMLFLPEPHTDYIYAVISEELGLIGATGVLLCFCVIAWRGLRIALRSEDAFGSFVAVGLTVMISVQAFINMGVVLSLLPSKGLPLPLVSSGGSSLVASLISIGVLLNISQHATTTEA